MSKALLNDIAWSKNLVCATFTSSKVCLFVSQLYHTIWKSQHKWEPVNVAGMAQNIRKKYIFYNDK